MTPRSVAPSSLALLLLSLQFLPSAARSASLSPSHPSLLRQVEAAKEHALAYAATESDLRLMVAAGQLVAVPGNADYELKSGVPYPYARPEVKRFLENLGQAYRAACGERLVVTSLVRPRNRQPRNSSPLSVHPTGAAMDLRMHWKRGCRSWLESSLETLEDAAVLEAARELHPPHYHVVLFPRPYLAYLGEEVAPPAATAVAAVTSSPAPPPAAAEVGWPSPTEYRYVVRRGDTLWAIGRRYGTTTAALRLANGLTSSTLSIGQQLRVPVGGEAVAASAPDATYRVRPGDSLWRIARLHGTSPGTLQRANGLPSSRIHPGQVLRIPGGS